jgi:hypothetical protein
MSITKELYEYYKAQCKEYRRVNKKPRKARVWNVKPEHCDISRTTISFPTIKRLSEKQLVKLSSAFDKSMETNVEYLGYLYIGYAPSPIPSEITEERACEILNHCLNNPDEY